MVAEPIQRFRKAIIKCHLVIRTPVVRHHPEIHGLVRIQFKYTQHGIKRLVVIAGPQWSLKLEIVKGPVCVISPIGDCGGSRIAELKHHKGTV